MKQMLNSPTNIVLLLVTLTACLGFWFGKLDADKFVPLVTGVFGYFFGKAPDPGQPFGGK